MILIGVDIGGTKIAGGVVDFSDRPTVLSKRVAPTPSSSPAAILSSVVTIIRELDNERRARSTRRALDPSPSLAGVGIGAPGVIDPEAGRVVAASDVLNDWVGATIAETIESEAGFAAFVDNDVRAMARAEARFGAGRTLDQCLYVSLGTGVGGAIGRRDGSGGSGVIRGSRGSAGEIAHLVAPTPGAVKCGCGHDQHLESIVSGPAMSAEYTRRVGERVDLRDVGRRLVAGDETARAVVQRAGRIAGEVLSGVVSAFDLDGVVVGGGAADVSPLLMDSLAASMTAGLWPPSRRAVIRRTELGDDAPIIGAALVAHEGLNIG